MTCTILSSNTQDLITKLSIKCSLAMRLSRTMVSCRVSQMPTLQKLSKLVMIWSCLQLLTSNTKNKTKTKIGQRAVLKMLIELLDKDRFNLLQTKEKERNQPASSWKTKQLHKPRPADKNQITTKTRTDLSPVIKAKAPSSLLTSSNSNLFRFRANRPAPQL